MAALLLVFLKIYRMLRPLITTALILMGLAITLFGQEEPGYVIGCVITTKKDTLYGEVKNVNLFPYRVLENIKFKPEGSSKVVTYKPDELIAYLSGVDLYFAKELEDGDRSFVKQVLRGYLSLYSDLAVTTTATSAPGTPGGTLGGSSSTVYYLQKVGEPILTRVNANFLDGSFKDQMLKYLSDAPNLCKQIESKALKRKDIDRIVYLYNQEKKGR
jgi:hypothetical protein